MSDWKTPEFWVTTVTGIVIAVVAILVARGLLSSEEGELWVQLAAALVAPIAVIVLGMLAKSYTTHQTEVKSARLMSGLRELD